MRTFKTFIRITALWIVSLSSAFSQSGDFMTAHYIDVGQGQSMLLEFPHGAVLIDAGGQPDMKYNVVHFLEKFFARRTDLNNTLNTVFITHQHVDHDQALETIDSAFTILNYVDNGHNNPQGSGKKQIWMQQNLSAKHIKYKPVTFDFITSSGNKKGRTSKVIDAVDGDPTDPKITVYSGAFADGELSATEAKNENNHSLVIKVVYGKASFLFMGDLEEKAIEKVLGYYAGTKALRADVLQVGHHGSANATSDEWIRAVKPHYAIINVGQWTFGMKPDSMAVKFTTYAYGHPNKAAVDILQSEIPDLRDHPIKEHLGIKGAAPKTKKHPAMPPVFKVRTISHNLYATAWNGNISIKAGSDGTYSIVTEK